MREKKNHLTNAMRGGTHRKKEGMMKPANFQDKGFRQWAKQWFGIRQVSNRREEPQSLAFPFFSALLPARAAR